MKDIRLEISPRVYRILLDFIHDVGIRTFGIKSRYEIDKHILTIYTNHSRLIMGKHCERFERLKNKIHEDKFDKNVDIVIEEVDFFIRDDNESYTDREFIGFIQEYSMAEEFL